MAVAAHVECADYITSGAAYFQTQNIDGHTGAVDDAFYPLMAAPAKVSATTNLSTPYRKHSWLGGILWGTEQNESDYWLPNSTGTAWVQAIFRQHALWCDPMIIEYMQPPNRQGSDITSRGINLCAPYPYLAPDTPYDSSCQGGGYWTVTPLQLVTDSQYTLLIVPSQTPPSDPGPTPPAWSPTSFMVDRMGDWDADLIYQDPAVETNYLKFTVAQGSPFVFIESRGSQYVTISNRMQVIVAATSPAAVPGVSGVSYVLFKGNQNDPAIFDHATTLNPPALQDNFTTWALFYKTDSVTSFTAGTSTTSPQNSVIEFSNSGSTPNYFVIAQIPTVYAYPTAGDSYNGAVSAANLTDADAYAQELGKYAFNFITNTSIAYEVQDLTFLTTTYTASVSNPYQVSGMTADLVSTVMCLMPHQYQPVVFDTSLAAQDVLDLTGTGSVDFPIPADSSNLFYWSVRGNLKPILGPSFKTQYILNNFLPGMPPPSWGQAVSNPAKGFSTTIGQLLFDSIDNEYINNLANPTYAPWNTAYYNFSKGVYDVGKTLSKDAKQLSLLLQMLQAVEDNESSFVSSLFERQYNVRYDLIYRPGSFNTPSGHLPVSKLQAFINGLQSSSKGTLPPAPLAGVQGAISQYFIKKPHVSTASPWYLSHFAFYDIEGEAVELFPTSGDPSNGIIPWPSRVSNPTTHITGVPTALWEAFGVADAYNDHHYQNAYWIAAAALAALYDGAWTDPPSQGQWATQSQFGEAIDQLVKDIVYDPSNSDAFYNNSQMTFAKMNFFDQWSGHGWADGIQASIAGGGGHNENSILEGNQAYASIILWGMATGRKKIVDLGIYLYTTATYAADAYFYDKNLNLKVGNTAGFFVPTTTKTGDSNYPVGSAFWDFTIKTSGSSGTPKITQSGIPYSTDFGQTPQNVKFISAFPCAPWTLAVGRNKDYMNEWNDSMNTTAFTSLITSADSSCWKLEDNANMNMLAALGGNTQAYGTTTSVTPYQFMINNFTNEYAGNDNAPPWGSVGGNYNDPSQSINEVLHFLHVMDYYGEPDWTVYGHAVPNGDTLVFTAAFKKGSTTTYFAFNPTLSNVDVQFFQIGTNTAVTSSFTVKPKRWASLTQ
ncbi:MAG: hypothetical protein H7A37_07930 [Chlamydiales bacterium]|nr:hypothetical protein [Chlamydiia bacterium]MCP5508209.1 hypothetical protein [Chlamydiales bacterium]